MAFLPLANSSLSPSLRSLTQALIGEFSNPQQAIASPAWFVHLRLWQCPTPLFAEDSITLFLEQANILQLDRPYRQRLLRLSEDQGQLFGQYYQFKDFSAWKGCGQTPGRLQTLTPADIADLPGCRVAIAQTPTGEFQARLGPGRRCEFEYEGQKRQVVVGFDVAQSGATGVYLKTYDKGIDPETGQGFWGALMGPYEFEKLV
ncbi:MAG: hypothetical protein HC771_23005 [Synechococcales cyanobacterium CRU_2_2]|nr:hypothetical protein [Synechococcales cyanobacterium CRU_2_2]